MLCMQTGHQGHLQDDDKGDAILKLLVHRLVVPNLHARPRSYATPDDSQGQQCGFRNAPSALLGFVFVKAIKQEGHGIGFAFLCHDSAIQASLMALAAPSVGFVFLLRASAIFKRA